MIGGRRTAEQNLMPVGGAFASAADSLVLFCVRCCWRVCFVMEMNRNRPPYDVSGPSHVEERPSSTGKRTDTDKHQTKERHGPEGDDGTGWTILWLSL